MHEIVRKLQEVGYATGDSVFNYLFVFLVVVVGPMVKTPPDGNEP